MTYEWSHRNKHVSVMFGFLWVLLVCGICWTIEKAREFHKNIYFCFIDYAKAFDSVDHNELWKILKKTGIP